MNGFPNSTWQKNIDDAALSIPANNTFICNITNRVLFAFALRKVNANYNGALIQVRRSRDNATLDIYPNQFGLLDTKTMQDFCPTGNGFVTTWYDQSGNGYNITNGTALTQPRIITNGELETMNGVPCMNITRCLLTYPTTAFDWNDGYSVLVSVNIFANPIFSNFAINPISLFSGANNIGFDIREQQMNLGYNGIGNALTYFGGTIRGQSRVCYAQWGKTTTPLVDSFGLGYRTNLINSNSFVSTTFQIGRPNEGETGIRKINELYLFNGNMIPDQANLALSRRTNTRYDETFLNILKNVAKYNSVGLPI